MDEKQTKVLAILVAIILIGFVGWAIYNQIKEYHYQDDPKLQEIKKIFNEFFSQENYWAAPLDMLNGRDIMSEISL